MPFSLATAREVSRCFSQQNLYRSYWNQIHASCLAHHRRNTTSRTSSFDGIGRLREGRRSWWTCWSVCVIVRHWFISSKRWFLAPIIDVDTVRIAYPNALVLMHGRRERLIASATQYCKGCLSGRCRYLWWNVSDIIHTPEVSDWSMCTVHRWFLCDPVVTTYFAAKSMGARLCIPSLERS